MKKYLKLLFVFIIGFMLVPMVSAAELPTEGVTYFMHYPDGSERTTTNYSEASDPKEVLIYSGETNANGEIPLCNWDNSGQLRIVQHVPNGYTTNIQEMTVDLSDMSKASFIDYRGIDNPGTGRSLLVLFGIIAASSVTVLVSRKNKKSLMVIPVVVALAVVVTAEAATCPCIKIKDGSGNALVGVKVDIYAKPTSVDAAAAIKFDANGGYFFDGTTEIVMRLPSSSCTMSEFLNSLSESERDYLMTNAQLAYRDKYRVNGMDNPNTVSNGDVLKLYWESDPESDLVVIDGNGGSIDFYGKELTRVTTYAVNEYAQSIADAFKNGKYFNIGVDTTPACNRYSSYGITRNISERGTSDYKVIGTYYVCWNNRPDGIYVNGILFLGNDETCYSEGYFESESDNSFTLHSKDGHVLTISDIGNEDINFVLYSNQGVEAGPASPLTPGEEITRDALLKLNNYGEEVAITSIEIVKDGKTVAKYLAEDLEEDGVYYILNDETIYDAIEYMQGMYDNNCLRDGSNG